MTPALIISPDPALSEQLERGLEELGRTVTVRKLTAHPPEHELVRVIRAHAPQLFFVDVGRLEPALGVIAAIHKNAFDSQIIAVGREAAQPILLALMRSGVREFVAISGGTSAELPMAVARAIEVLQRKPPSVSATDKMYTFLPSKPGVGASTIAMNAAVAMSGNPDVRALLLDFDLNCGMIGFMMHIDVDTSIVEAAEHSAHLDEQVWPRLVVNRGDLDVIPSGRLRPGFRIEPMQIRYLIEFARRNYEVICADLSGLMERYSIELMQESKHIFLVVTPELTSVYLARQKVEYLRTLDIEDRVRLIVNRAHKNAPVSTAEIQQVVGLPVVASFPNDYRAVHRALTEGKPVPRPTELGRRFGELAQQLITGGPAPEQARRFVDYFTLTPLRLTNKAS